MTHASSTSVASQFFERERGRGGETQRSPSCRQRGVGEENEAFRSTVRFVTADFPPWAGAPLFHAPTKTAGQYLQRRDPRSQMNHQMFRQTTGLSQSWNDV